MIFTDNTVGITRDDGFNYDTAGGMGLILQSATTALQPVDVAKGP